MKKIIGALVISSVLLLSYQSVKAAERRHRFAAVATPARLPIIKFLASTPLIKELNLTDDQKQKIAKILNVYQSDLKTSLDGFLESTATVTDVIQADSYDEQAIRAAHRTAAERGEELAVLRGKIVSEVRQVLTSEQISTAKNFDSKLKNAVNAAVQAAEQMVATWIEANLTE